MTNQEKLAYELGMTLALQESGVLTKEASILGTGLKGLKWLAGMGGGTASRTIGGATGFGLMGAYRSERNPDGSINLGNLAKGFAGGFAGGLAFSGAMAGAGRAGKLLNMNRAKANTKFLQGNKAKMKAFKSDIAAQKKTLSEAGAPIQRATAREGLKASKSAYKDFLRANNISAADRLKYTLATRGGSALGVAGGLVGGYQLSQIPENYARSKMVVPYQSNPFNTAYYR